MKLETLNQYLTSKAKLDAYDAAARNYMNLAKSNSIPADVAADLPFASEATNDLRSALEVYEFCHNRPDKYFLYIDEKKSTATTWTGDQLGIVVFGRSYYSGLRDLCQSVIIHAINGLTYTGTYYKSAGDYARVTAKHPKTA